MTILHGRVAAPPCRLRRTRAAWLWGTCLGLLFCISQARTDEQQLSSAIYEIKGDKLTICWGAPGSDKRPKKFVTKTAVGAGVQMDTYQKEKE